MFDVDSPIADSQMPVSMTAQLPNMADTAKIVAAAHGARGTGHHYAYGRMGRRAAALSGVGDVTPEPVTNAPGITPQYLLDRLPSIIQPAPAVAPASMSDTGACDPFSQWVSDNGLLVGIAMAFGLVLVWHQK